MAENPNICYNCGQEGHLARDCPTPTATPPQMLHQQQGLTTTPLTVPPATGGGKQVKFENALDFLHQVKQVFASQPRVYNQFLDIMKDFKAQCIDTPGVIARVSELFKGHKNLILGFNTFLPPGYKIEMPDEDQVRIETQAGVAPQPLPPVTQLPPPQQQAALQAPPANQRKQPEFDSARSYVKKIKMRFATQPHIYKAFLEILHNYHKEQQSIKEVYEQVAQLFQDELDLLDEFTQFLPDPMQQQMPYVGPSTRGAKPKAPKQKASAPKLEKEKPERPIRKPSRKRRYDDEEDEMDRLGKTATHEEMSFFERVKSKLGDQQQFYEFLKCLLLFSQGIITRLELLLLLKDLFARNRDVYDWFKQFLGFDESSAAYIEKMESQTTPVPKAAHEIDFKQCKRYGPSYRALPSAFIPPLCSGRTELCDSVLNDQWVSMPTGREDGFRHLRRNQYEEMLFKCEDDRFQLDLIIELNASTIRILQEILSKFEDNNADDEAKYKLQALDIIRVRSIERIYREKASEVIDMIYHSPVTTIPIVLERLKQRDREWRSARREWNKVWREVNEKNYYKSLDHQSFYFKQNDKKNLSPKVLFAEIKQKYQQQLRLRHKITDPNLFGDDEEESLKMDKINNNNNESGNEKMEVDTMNGTGEEKSDAERRWEEKRQKELEIHDWHLKYIFRHEDTAQLFDDILEFVERERYLNKSDREKIEVVFKHFFNSFFCINKQQQPQSTSTSTTTESSDKMEVDGAQPTNDSNGVSKDHKPKPVQTNIFFGGTTLYIVFRLLQILYERLSKAYELAYATPANTPNYYFLGIPKSAENEDSAEKYAAFKRMVLEFQAGTREQTMFEDDSRNILGMHSYVTHTIDKLITQFTKQLQQMLSEETCSKLLACYSYESTRAGGVNEKLYHSSAVSALEGDRCFKFVFSKFPTGDGELTVQLLDSVNNPPAYVALSTEDRQALWADYVHKYTTQESTLDPRKHKVFLLRNKKAAKPTTNLFKDYQLECRISLTNYKMFYVEHTEDVLYRLKSLPKAKLWHKKGGNKAQRQARLNEVIQKIQSKKTQSSAEQQQQQQQQVQIQEQQVNA